MLQVKNLKTNTDYEFKIRTYNKYGGVSSYSNAVEVKTTIGTAGIFLKVQHLKYSLYNESTVCISWGPPLYKVESVLYYSISYTPDQNWPLETWFNVTANKNSRVCLMIIFDNTIY